MKRTKIFITIITIFLFSIPVALFAAWDRGGFFFGRGLCGAPFGWHFFGGIPFLTLILLGIAVFFAVKAFNNSKRKADKAGSPLEILKVRYAKGEISREDFNSMKNDL